jgi:hypothetical protein
VETRNGASKTTCEIDDKNQIEEQFISSQSFHRAPGGRIQKTTTGEQLKLENLDLFDPVAQDKTNFLPATIHKQREQKLPPKYLQTNFRSAVSS